MTSTMNHRQLRVALVVFTLGIQQVMDKKQEENSQVENFLPVFDRNRVMSRPLYQ